LLKILDLSTRECFNVRPLDIYIAALTGMGVGLVGVSAFQLPQTPHKAEWLLLACLALVTGRFALQIRGLARFSVSDAFFLSSGVLFGPGPATVTIAINGMYRSYGRGYPLQRVLFDGSVPAIAFWAGCRVFSYLLGVGPLFDSPVAAGRVVVPVAALVAVYYLLNSGFNAVAVGFETRTSPIEVWRGQLGVAAAAAGSDDPETLMALANLARIVQDGPTPADVGSVAWSHIRHLVPGATCGFFMIDRRTGSAVARFVAGPSAQVLQGLHMKVGERLTGWVAEHAQPVINSDASLDLGHGAALANLERCLSVPLIHADQVVGVLSLYGAAPFDERQSQTIQLVAPSLAQMFAAVAAPSAIKASRPTLVRFTA
jgi:putative methionine-R-sulfoxide reductase with GAF domain